MRCVPAHDFTVAKALAWRSAIADDPPYQRESSIWSLEKQQLFVDSLLNGYDVPKIYLHDLRGKHPTRVYAVVDGKQRLTTIWRFTTDEFALADDFKIEPANLPDLPEGVPHPAAGQRFSQFHPAWQHVLRTTYLAVVLIQNATEEDIEDLFSRLNNGEPLNAAEKRNAMHGDATRLVRTIAAHRFFRERVRFTNARYHHHDAAARLLVIEAAALRGTGTVPDLRSRALDSFMRANRRIPPADRRELRDRVSRHLDRMCEVFASHDPLLASQASPQLYYLLVRQVSGTAPHGWEIALRDGLAEFHEDRRAQLQRPEEEQDPVLREFSELMHTGANEPRSLSRRLVILVRRLRQSTVALDDVIAADVAAREPRKTPSLPGPQARVNSDT
jgi:hypothetical protein